MKFKFYVLFLKLYTNRCWENNMNRVITLFPSILSSPKYFQFEKLHNLKVFSFLNCRGTIYSLSSVKFCHLQQVLRLCVNKFSFFFFFGLVVLIGCFCLVLFKSGIVYYWCTERTILSATWKAEEIMRNRVSADKI